MRVVAEFHQQGDEEIRQGFKGLGCHVISSCRVSGFRVYGFRVSLGFGGHVNFRFRV